MTYAILDIKKLARFMKRIKISGLITYGHFLLKALYLENVLFFKGLIFAHIVFFLLLREPRSLQVDQSLSQCTDSGQESLRAVDQSKSASQRPVRPLEQLGQPFDSSSPITSRGVRQEI